MENQLHLKIKASYGSPEKSGFYYTNVGHAFYSTETEQWCSNDPNDKDAVDIGTIYVYSWFKTLDISLNEVTSNIVEAEQQIDYLQEKFQKTGTGNSVLSKLKLIKEKLNKYF